MLRIFILIFITFFFVSCGYKPSSKFSRNVIGEKVSTSIVIAARDPENSVIIKDSVDEAVIKVFRSSLVSKNESDTHLVFSIDDPSYTPIQYDQDGYVSAYRTTLKLSVERHHKGSVKRYKTKGVYDFSIDPKKAIITDQERFEAIKNSAVKAIDSFLAKVSAEGAKGY